jgi:hypothetical protein
MLQFIIIVKRVKLAHSDRQACRLNQKADQDGCALLD